MASRALSLLRSRAHCKLMLQVGFSSASICLYIMAYVFLLLAVYEQRTSRYISLQTLLALSIHQVGDMIISYGTRNTHTDFFILPLQIIACLVTISFFIGAVMMRDTPPSRYLLGGGGGAYGVQARYYRLKERHYSQLNYWKEQERGGFLVDFLSGLKAVMKWMSLYILAGLLMCVYIFVRKIKPDFSTLFEAFTESVFAVALLPQLYMIYDKQSSPVTHPLSSFTMCYLLSRVFSLIKWLLVTSTYKNAESRYIHYFGESCNIIILLEFAFLFARAYAKSRRIKLPL